MIFAADLDGSLLFSQRRLLENVPVVPVEYRQQEPYGFMTSNALKMLCAIQQRAVSAIITLRGLEQARRVCFVADGSCRYLSLQNGLYLYRNGVLDKNWASHVARTVNEIPLGLTEAAAIVQRELPGIECLSKQYEYLAVFFVDQMVFDDTLCAQLEQTLEKKGWCLHHQRKKLYLSPVAIDKGAVLQRICALEETKALGFGDSWFDLPMLRACACAWAPGGSELDGGNWGFPICFSSQQAQLGCEEILAQIYAAL